MFLIYLSRHVGQVVRAVSTQRQRALADVSSYLEETLSISGALLIRSFGRQPLEITRFGELNDELVTIQVRQTMLSRWFLLSFHIFFNLVPVLVYYVGGLQVIGGTLSLGTLVAFVALQSALFPSVREMLDVHISLQEALALFERIFAYLDLPTGVRNHPNAHELTEVSGQLRFRHVSFHYRPEQPALVDIDFEARRGQLVALVGPSGAGKTTLAYLAARLYDVEQGAVEIDGQDVRALTLESLGQHIGIVAQESYLLNTTVRENIAYSQNNATEEEIITAAQAAQIHERILALPAGYDTPIGPRGYTLSGGEKQRLAIARVLLKNPRILILDEATSSLDSQSECLIQSALERVMAGRTILAIAHRLSTILAADLILVMQNGQICERGTHVELLQRDGLYARLYKQQFAAILLA